MRGHCFRSEGTASSGRGGSNLFVPEAAWPVNPLLDWPTTSVAARLLDFARLGQMVISAATRYATEGAFVFGDLGGVAVEA